MDDGFKKPEEIVAKEKEGHNVEENSAEKDEELAPVTTAASERSPLSKARSIALVATVGAAPFLSVSYQDLEGEFVADGVILDLHGSSHGDHSADCRRSAQHTYQ